MKVKKLTITSLILFFSLFFVFPINSVGIDDPDDTFEIDPNNYRYVYWTSLAANYLITVEVEVTAGGNEEINVYLCDSDGFYEFENEASFTAKKVYFEYEKLCEHLHETPHGVMQFRRYLNNLKNFDFLNLNLVKMNPIGRHYIISLPDNANESKQEIETYLNEKFINE